MTLPSPVDWCGLPPPLDDTEPAMEPALPSGADIAAALVTRKTAAAAPKSSASQRAAPPAADLKMTRKETTARTTLVLAGALDSSTIGGVRDQAFTEIGTRPKRLCLDLSDAGLPDSVSTDALVTIGNVARMMGVAFCVRVSPPFARLLEDTGLLRLVPLDTETETSL